MPSWTINYDAQDGTDFAIQVGRDKRLKDLQTGLIRSATNAEAKDDVIEYIESKIRQYRRDEAIKVLEIAEPNVT